MSEFTLIPRLAIGTSEPVTRTIGAITLTERPELAFASVAIRKNQDSDLAAAMKPLISTPLPGPASSTLDTPIEALWTGPGQWMCMCRKALHADLEAVLKKALGSAGSVTDQSDAWVAIDVEGATVAALFEGLTNLDLASRIAGYTTRTVMEHIGIYLQIRRANEGVRIFVPRSFATNCFQILDTAAKSLAARTAISQE